MFAGACRAFFDVVFSMSKMVVFVVDNTSTEKMFQASTWLLDRTIEVHWSSVSFPGWKACPYLYSNGRSSHTNSFKIMLPLLSGCGNLSSLVLTGIIVSGEHQQAIYSLPHLRKITLQSSRFQCTS